MSQVIHVLILLQSVSTQAYHQHSEEDHGREIQSVLSLDSGHFQLTSQSKPHRMRR